MEAKGKKSIKVLVTGAAGFIGSRLAYELAKRGDDVVGVDSINDYYDTRLKYGRLRECGIDCNEALWKNEYKSDIFPNYRFIRLSIDDKASVDALFEMNLTTTVLHTGFTI